MPIAVLLGSSVQFTPLRLCPAGKCQPAACDGGRITKGHCHSQLTGLLSSNCLFTESLSMQTASEAAESNENILPCVMCLLQIIQITSSGSNGEVTEQTMMVSSQENVAAFHIEGNTTSATVVYDYKHSLIGFRVQDRRKCLVVKMDKVAIPSLAEITQRIENFATQVPGDNSMSYSFRERQLADRTTLGTSLNLLCSDVPIYWAENMQKERRGWSLCVGIYIFSICYNF
uniref:BRICHOS domain-containing protein n=1 Tax=Chrysemys picta bellii TaxID=8478 RepID=A0A8C3FZG8_CHRPI